MYYISGMGKRLTHNEAIKRFKEKHGDKYDYSLVEYKGNNYKVKIKCKQHGIFEQTFHNHSQGQGCPICRLESIGNSSRKTTEYFVEKAKLYHGDTYDYSLVKYKNAKNKVSIRCYKHGVFQQTPDNHLQGQGCSYCGRIKTTNSQKINPTGWRAEDWERQAKESKYFHSFKVYVIRCWSDNEEFYKIGRTYTSIKRRFKQIKLMPYNYEVIKELTFENANDCYNKEIELKRLHKEFKYLPEIKFKGKHECFYKIDIRD